MPHSQQPEGRSNLFWFHLNTQGCFALELWQSKVTENKKQKQNLKPHNLAQLQPAALRREELLMGSRHKSNHLLSLQSQTGIVSILLGQKMKNSTTKVVSSSSVCSKDNLSASSSCKSHGNPFYLMHRNMWDRLKTPEKSQFHNSVFGAYKEFTSGSRKARQKIPVEGRKNIQIFDKSSQQEIKLLY